MGCILKIFIEKIVFKIKMDFHIKSSNSKLLQPQLRTSYFSKGYYDHQKDVWGWVLCDDTILSLEFIPMDLTTIFIHKTTSKMKIILIVTAIYFLLLLSIVANKLWWARKAHMSQFHLQKFCSNWPFSAAVLEAI